MATKKDYYDILGVSRDADEKAIKAAYRRLARKYHPDVNKEAGSEDRFKEVSEAFAVLSDPQKRAQYDRGGHAAFGPDFDPFAGFGFDFRGGGRGGDFGFPHLSEIFEMFGMGGAGMGRGRSRVRRGSDLQLEVRIPFREAVLGTTLSLVIPRQAGSERIEDRVKVRIPAGIQDRGRVRLAGRGDAPPGGAPGDAFLIVRVEPDSRFRREGRDLLTDVPVSLARAALGGTVTVPTLDGSTTINLPAGTRSGQKLRLRGKGVPQPNSSPAGDLFAVVQIHPPKKLDKRSRELLEEFERLNPTP